MAFAELVCTCDASFQLDIEDESQLMGMVLRFAEQHVACGYIAAAQEEPQTLRIRHVADDEYEVEEGNDDSTG